MSFIEVRNFVEKLKILRYPKPLSLDSFAYPNFQLMAEILVWLTKSYDPSIQLSLNVSTVEERVRFVKNAVTLLASKAQFRLNTRKLYIADSQCVSELSKIANVVYAATQFDGNKPEHKENVDSALDLSIVDSCRGKAKQLFDLGSSVHELLTLEQKIFEKRSSAMSKSYDLQAVGKVLQDALKHLIESEDHVRVMTTDQSSDLVHLQDKVTKRQKEVDRLYKRLESLQKVRPAHQDEYDALQNNLIKDYAVYVEHARSLAYLEAQLLELKSKEQQRLEESQAFFRDAQLQIQENAKQMLRNESELGQVEAVSVLKSLHTSNDGDIQQARFDDDEIIDISDDKNSIDDASSDEFDAEPQQTISQSRTSVVRSHSGALQQQFSGDSDSSLNLRAASGDNKSISQPIAVATNFTGDSDDDF